MPNGFAHYFRRAKIDPAALPALRARTRQPPKLRAAIGHIVATIGRR
jgi:hypothetical protein